MDPDYNRIKDLHSRWIAHELAGETSRVLELCTDDVRWIPPDSPPLIGNKAIANYLSMIKVEPIEIEITGLEIHNAGSAAYLTSNYRSRFCSQGDSEVHQATGSHLWISAESRTRRLACSGSCLECLVDASDFHYVSLAHGLNHFTSALRRNNAF